MSELNIQPFLLTDETNAPEKSKPYLAKAEQAFGLIPNVERVMAQAPSLLASYMTAWDEFNESSLSDVEKQIVYQTANFENNCQYCMPWHTLLSQSVGMLAHDVKALRTASPLLEQKHEALRHFSRDLIRTQGSIEPSALSSFFKAGYNEQQALEVVLGIAIKTMSNYTNAIAQTPLDEQAQSQAWTKPSLRA